MKRFGRFVGTLVLAEVCLLGCGADSGEKRPVPASSAKVDIPPIQWTSHYGGQAFDSSLSSREKTLYSRILERASLTCKLDSRLRDTARAYGRLLALSETEVQESDIDRVRFVLAQHGAADYLIQAFVAKTDEASEGILVSLIRENSTEWTHCGVGVYQGEDAGRGVFIGVRRIVSLEPFPVAPSLGSPSVMRGRVETQLGRQVKIFLGTPDGSVERLPPALVSETGMFETTFVFNKRGRYDIELLVEGDRGAETAVLVPVFVGTEPDAFPTVVVEPEADNRGLSSADALTSYLTQFRARHGLPPLKRDARLDAVAAAHSTEMAERHYFGHVSPVYGGLAQRLEKYGIRPERFAENVARSCSPYRIHSNLMRSPSHRINALDPMFSHVGIGVAKEGEDLIATQVFVSF